MTDSFQSYFKMSFQMLDFYRKKLDEENNEQNSKNVKRCIHLIEKILDKTETMGIGYLKGLNQLARGGHVVLNVFYKKSWNS